MKKGWYLLSTRVIAEIQIVKVVNLAINNFYQFIQGFLYLLAIFKLNIFIKFRFVNASKHLLIILLLFLKLFTKLKLLLEYARGFQIYPLMISSFEVEIR